MALENLTQKALGYLNRLHPELREGVTLGGIGLGAWLDGLLDSAQAGDEGSDQFVDANLGAAVAESGTYALALATGLPYIARTPNENEDAIIFHIPIVGRLTAGSGKVVSAVAITYQVAAEALDSMALKVYSQGKGSEAAAAVDEAFALDQAFGLAAAGPAYTRIATLTTPVETGALVVRLATNGDNASVGSDSVLSILRVRAIYAS